MVLWCRFCGVVSVYCRVQRTGFDTLGIGGPQPDFREHSKPMHRRNSVVISVVATPEINTRSILSLNLFSVYSLLYF